MRERMPLWWRLALKEILAVRGFTATFVFNLSLGLMGFLALDSFKDSVHSHLQSRSKAILAADLRVSTRRPVDEEELAKVRAMLPDGAVERREISFYSMAVGKGGSRLVEIRAVDENFPFYGELTLEGKPPITHVTPKGLVTEREAWIYPELKVQLGVDEGDFVKLGDVEFRVAGVVSSDPSVSSIGFATAPKIFIGMPHVDDLGLIRKGSRVYSAWLYKLPEGIDADELEKRLEKAFPGSDLRFRSHENANPEMGRVLSYLNDYLGLVALVAVFLAGVGASYLFRSFLGRRCKDIAILLSLGTSRATVQKIYLTQLVLLGLLATVVTLAVSSALVPLLPKAVGSLLADGIEVGVTPRGILLAVVMGVGSSVLFCLPILTRIRTLNPQALFREDANPSLSFIYRQALGWIPALLVYWGLAIWQAKSVKIGSLFVGLFLGSGLLIGLFGILSLRIVRRLKAANLSLHMALLNLSRHRVATLACFLAVGLGALLINLVPQIRVALTAELEPPDGEEAPSLFLFDIQDEQVEALESMLAGEGVRLDFASPMITARLDAINGNPNAELDDPENRPVTREQEQEGRMRRRTYNLSYRAQLAPSERLVEGRPFSGTYVWDEANPAPAEMSLELRFAERLGLKIGDTMTFDVQGIPVTGKVVNIRRVRWTSFQPNFFVQFQPGVLDDAPKTWVAAVPALPFERKVELQNEIVRAFPNISIIDVTQTIDRILGVVGQMTIAITLMAWLSLIAGLAVLYSIAQHQAEQRVKDTTLLKVLGAKFGDVRRITALEFGSLGGAAAVIGAALSLIVSYSLSTYIFDGAWTFSPWVPVATAVGVTALSMTTGLLATRRALRSRPALLLNSARY